MINKENIREQFPYLKTGKIYLNHASLGPLPKSTAELLTEYIYDRSRDSVEDFEKILKIEQDTKNLLAKFINTDPDRIAFIDNVSNAMNVLANGIKWQPMDEIILFDIEFPANVYPFMNLTKYEVKLNILKSNSGKIDIDLIKDSITDKTKLLTISHVQFLSGYRANLIEIGKICKEKNVILSVDAIQSFGVVDIDVKEMNIDFLASGIQKWFLGLEGTSFFVISEELQNKIDQKFVGWLSVKNPWDILDYNLELLPSAKRFENGTLNYAGIISLYSSLKFFNSLGMKNVEAEILDNTQYLINGLKEKGFELYCDFKSQEEMAGIVTIKHPRAKEIVNLLKAKNIICSLREGMVRFSPHFYNTKEEIDLVMDILSKNN